MSATREVRLLNAKHAAFRRIVTCLASLAVFAAREARADEAAPAPAEQAAPPPSTAKEQPFIACTAFEGPRVPPTQEPRTFGTPGDLVLGNLVGLSSFSSGTLVAPTGGVFLTAGWLSYSSSEYSQPPGTGHATALSIAPDFDVFVAPKLSLGGQLAFSRATIRGPLESTAQALNVRPRVGWAIAMSDDFALWTRASVGLGASRTTSESVAADGTSAKRTASLLQWRLGLDVVLVAKVSRAVALTFGPTASYGEVVGTPPTDYGTTTTSSFNLGVSGGISLVL